MDKPTDILEQFAQLFQNYGPIPKIPKGKSGIRDRWAGYEVSLNIIREGGPDDGYGDTLKLVTCCLYPRQLDGMTIIVYDVEGRIIAGEVLTRSDRNPIQHWVVLHGLPNYLELCIAAHRIEE